MTPPDHTLNESRRREFVVLLTISTGLILIIVLIVAGIFGWFKRTAPIPDWAENVLVAIATAAILKLGDCLNALVQLATGRQVSQLGEKLAASAPADPPTPVPQEAVEGAQSAADAAQERVDDLKRD